MTRATVTRPTRALVAAFFALMLVGMQGEGLRHSIAHHAAALLAPHEQSLQLPNDAPCVECQLLAGATAMSAVSIQAMPIVAAPWLASVFSLVTAPTSAPVHYQSRAPPSPD